VSACDRADEWSRALEVLPAMQAAAVAPNIVTFSTLLDVCVHADDWQAALTVHAAMPNSGTQVKLQSGPFRNPLHRSRVNSGQWIQRRAREGSADRKPPGGRACGSFGLSRGSVIEPI